MTVYSGIKEDEGAGPQTVLKDGKPLSPKPSQKLWNHSPDGFNWGYHGSGPAQLALALLIDVYPATDTCVRLHQDFKRAYVATWGDSWTITDIEIRDWLSKALATAGN